MKTLLLLLFSLATILLLPAQNVPCSSFCITYIEMDTSQANNMLITIYYHDNEGNWINYPHISLITNSQGDTIGSSSLDFFAHMANTSQTYQINTSIDSVPQPFDLLVYFSYDTSTCLLDYPCTPNGIYSSDSPIELSVYPNPTTEYINITIEGRYVENTTLKIFNSTGELIGAQTLDSGNQKIDFSTYPKGIYLISVIHENWVVTKKVLLY